MKFLYFLKSFISFLHPRSIHFSAGFSQKFRCIRHVRTVKTSDLCERTACSKLLTSGIQVLVYCVTAIATSHCWTC